MATAVKPPRRIADRRVADVRWKHDVETNVRKLQEGQARNEQAIAENTQLTVNGLANITLALNTQTAQTKPLTDALGYMESGIKTIGVIGRFGKRVLTWGACGIGGWLFLKHFIAGEGIEAAVAAFWKAVAGK